MLPKVADFINICTLPFVLTNLEAFFSELHLKNGIQIVKWRTNFWLNMSISAVELLINCCWNRKADFFQTLSSSIFLFGTQSLAKSREVVNYMSNVVTYFANFDRTLSGWLRRCCGCEVGAVLRACASTDDRDWKFYFSKVITNWLL